jgi:hypothetical protein
MLYQLSYTRTPICLGRRIFRTADRPWWGKDLNLRRRSPADLQSAPIDRSGTPPLPRGTAALLAGSHSPGPDAPQERTASLRRYVELTKGLEPLTC